MKDFNWLWIKAAVCNNYIFYPYYTTHCENGGGGGERERDPARGRKKKIDGDGEKEIEQDNVRERTEVKRSNRVEERERE